MIHNMIKAVHIEILKRLKLKGNKAKAKKTLRKLIDD